MGDAKEDVKEEAVVKEEEEKKEEEVELTGGECDLRAAQFVEITGTDEACAHFFLQDCGWDLQVGVSRFYEQAGVEENNGDNETRVVKRKEPSSPVKENPTKTAKKESGKFLLLTWNVDGMEPRGLETRIRAVCTIVLGENPDVVHLQEVSAEAERIIGGFLASSYDIHTSRSRFDPEPYYTLSLARRSSVTLRSSACRRFPTSLMGRSMLFLRTTIGDWNVDFVNTHSESTAKYKSERCAQHEAAIAELMETDSCAILAGDLNARDNEIGGVKGFGGVRDAWVQLGSRKFTQYTWDAAKNDNIQLWLIFTCCSKKKKGGKGVSGKSGKEKKKKKRKKFKFSVNPFEWGAFAPPPSSTENSAVAAVKPTETQQATSTDNSTAAMVGEAGVTQAAPTTNMNSALPLPIGATSGTPTAATSTVAGPPRPAQTDNTVPKPSCLPIRDNFRFPPAKGKGDKAKT